MADWREALRARGLAAGGLTALLADWTPQGASATKALFWDDRPQGSGLGAVMLTAVSDERPQLLKDWDYPPARVQVDCLGGTTAKAWAIAEAALAAFIGPFTQSGHKFSRADVALGLRSMAPERQPAAITYRVSFDLIFYHIPFEEEGS